MYVITYVFKWLTEQKPGFLLIVNGRSLSVNKIINGPKGVHTKCKNMNEMCYWLNCVPQKDVEVLTP